MSNSIPIVMSPRSFSTKSMSMSRKSEELQVIEIKNNKVPTKGKKKLNFLETYENFMENFPNWDIFMILEILIFFLSFVFLASEKIKDRNFLASSYLFYVVGMLILDFLFRLLSIRIKSIKREYWNNTLLCIIPLIMWLLAALFQFDNVFGSDAIQVLNVLIFTILNLIVFIIILLKFVTLEKIKDLFKKKEKTEKTEELMMEEPGMEEINDIESPSMR
jgi:hypothetical protein